VYIAREMQTTLAAMLVPSSRPGHHKDEARPWQSGFL
jgi:hypothetical protein